MRLAVEERDVLRPGAAAGRAKAAHREHVAALNRRFQRAALAGQGPDLGEDGRAFVQPVGHTAKGAAHRLSDDDVGDLVAGDLVRRGARDHRRVRVEHLAGGDDPRHATGDDRRRHIAGGGVGEDLDREVDVGLQQCADAVQALAAGSQDPLRCLLAAAVPPEGEVAVAHGSPIEAVVIVDDELGFGRLGLPGGGDSPEVGHLSAGDEQVALAQPQVEGAVHQGAAGAIRRRGGAHAVRRDLVDETHIVEAGAGGGLQREDDAVREVAAGAAFAHVDVALGAGRADRDEGGE